MSYPLKYIFLFFLIHLSWNVFGQVPPEAPAKPFPKPGLIDPQLTEQDTSKEESDLVMIDHADIAIGITGEGRQLFKEVRQVELRQGNVYMYCDSAFLYDNNDVRAWGNVIIQQGDSVNIFSDSLLYKGFDKKADLFGEVVLESENQKLFTNKLTYDLTTKVATYFNGATLTNDTTQLKSKIGYFYVDQNEAYFKDSVTVIDPEFELKTDTLKFDTKNKIAHFLGPTLIAQNEGKIYCEDGFYDTRNKQAEFTKNAQYQKEEQKAWADVMLYDGNIKETTLIGNARFIDGEKRAKADVIRYEEENEITNLEGNAFYEDEKQAVSSERIRYDSKNEVYTTVGRSRMVDPPQILEADNIDYDGTIGIATGNVVWQDTVENISISHCDSATYIKEQDFFKAMGGRPLLTTLMDGDTLLLTSDTLLALKQNPDDSIRTLIAYEDVRLLKSDLQAVCDSLVYSEIDSLFKFYKDPIIWSDTSQFSADTINLQLVEKKVDRIYLYRNSLMINSPDEIYYNQIKGKNITVFFKDEEVYRMKVVGNAESVYYALDDDDAYIGANKTVASEMMLYFGSNEITNIKFYNQAKAKFSPIQKAIDSELRLKGFFWEKKRRPKTLEDLFKIQAKAKPVAEKKSEDKNPESKADPEIKNESEPKPKQDEK